jgi:nucleotide-binding universal stress UspA family protein
MSHVSPTAGTPIASSSEPRPDSEQRDEDGRRISVLFESRQRRPDASSDRCWLVALDGSGHSMHALSEAMRLAVEGGAGVLDLATVVPWLSKEAAETELARRGWTIAAEACAMLDANALGWRLHVLMGEPADRLIQHAQALGSRGVVVGARGLSATETLLLGSVAQKVIHSMRGTIVVVRGDR